RGPCGCAYRARADRSDQPPRLRLGNRFTPARGAVQPGVAARARGSIGGRALSGMAQRAAADCHRSARGVMHRSRPRIVVRALAAAGAGTAACACARAANGAPPPVTGSAGNSAIGAFAAALEPRTFEFPRDHGPHPAFRQEWWYFTGNLAATDGERFG